MCKTGTLGVVSNGSKILIWKQITTVGRLFWLHFCCFQWFKDTNLKANHNSQGQYAEALGVVSNGSKILIWKQITTGLPQLGQQFLLFPMVQRY